MVSDYKSDTTAVGGTSAGTELDQSKHFIHKICQRNAISAQLIRHNGNIRRVKQYEKIPVLLVACRRPRFIIHWLNLPIQISLMELIRHQFLHKNEFDNY